jgi:hypothetical protein
MNHHIEKINLSIAGLRDQIIQHEVYSQINDINDLKIFMRYHVFAVWDFMSLLKALQNNLTCTSVPWFPVGSADTRFLINEIVVGEESDVDDKGIRKSHFEIYLDAMQQCQADVNSIELFLNALRSGSKMDLAYEAAQVPEAARSFVNFTFNVIEGKKDYLQAAIFTFGREDLIPGMFHSIVNDIYKRLPESISTFKYYLERHIEVDGGHHSALALQMVSNLCGDDVNKWMEAEAVIAQSLEKRIQLWDGACSEIKKAKVLV